MGVGEQSEGRARAWQSLLAAALEMVHAPTPPHTAPLHHCTADAKQHAPAPPAKASWVLTSGALHGKQHLPQRQPGELQLGRGPPQAARPAACAAKGPQVGLRRRAKGGPRQAGQQHGVHKQQAGLHLPRQCGGDRLQVLLGLRLLCLQQHAADLRQQLGGGQHLP